MIESAHHHFIEPNSRRQLVDKLQHLVRYSDYLILLLGESGSGRTRMLEQVANLSAENSQRLALISLQQATDVTALLTHLVVGLGAELPADADNRARLTEIHRLAKGLAEVGMALVILIDNADLLSDNALELLIGLRQLGAATPRLLLSGLPEFQMRAEERGLYRRLEGKVHLQRLNPLDAQESEAFIAALLPADADPDPNQVKRLVLQAEGNLSALKLGVIDLLREGRVSSRSGAMPIPPAHLAGIGAVLLLITSFAVWHYLPSQTVEETTTQIVLPLDQVPFAQVEEEVVEIQVMSELERRLAEQEALLAAQPSLEQDPLLDQPDPTLVAPQPQPQLQPEAPLPAPVAPVAEVEQTPAPAPASAPAPVVAAPAPTPVAPPPAPPAPSVAPAATPSAPPVASAQRSAGPSGSYLRADELMGWPDSGYTLQILGARSEENVVRFIQAQAQPQRFYYFKTLLRDEPWHVVVYGQYNSRSAAVAAVNQLPKELRDRNPWPRSIAGVKTDIQKINQ
ncbi:SPOR domain-containing protein [Nitrincola tapanii]|uniref:SPOR domain-containing protein n=1 Tax=Nitrincola tapanii TaxID=1708751 RepID=A0A5A9W8E4_9GAMM|nr:AAA family ATPase [Nitrincola tapanii]KAA0876269.1 hypothetical protein E1H14_00595 [Nitrincola tapanii]